MDTFDSTCTQYLIELEQINLFERGNALNLHIESNKIFLPFFSQVHFISKHGVLGPDGSAPTPAVATVLLEYVLRNETVRPAAAEKISFRDLKGAGPLVTSFTGNTNRLIAQTFAGRLPDLEAACRDIRGEPAGDSTAADLFMRFKALPEVWLYLSFNDRDDDFPAQCNLLFNRSAEQYLTMKSLFVLGTSLVGSLIKFQGT
jgi:hypothetical protein